MSYGGTVGVVSGDSVRYPDFCQALVILGKPEATSLIWAKGHDVAENCNTICRNFKGEWVWLIGDDHVFDPDILLRLLSHQVDVVVPLCLKRTPPYDPVVYSRQNMQGEYVGVDLPETGLVEVYASGQAGMLLSRRALDAVGDPWFEKKGGPNEDLTFCAKLRAAGFRIWCDVDAPLGHIAPHIVWPAWREDAWHADLDLGANVRMPVRRVLKEEALV